MDWLLSGQVPTSKVGIVVGRLEDNTNQDNVMVNPYPSELTFEMVDSTRGL